MAMDKDKWHTILKAGHGDRPVAMLKPYLTVDLLIH